jgi:CBS domain-containing protein
MTPIGTSDAPLERRQDLPAFADAEVVDAMRLGLITCPPEATLVDVARTMATYRVHCVVVQGFGAAGERSWGVVSDADLVRAASEGGLGRSAADVARSELVTVAADEPLGRALALMARHGVSHLVVVQGHSGDPVGVLSTLDVADVVAWGEPAS